MKKIPLLLFCIAMCSSSLRAEVNDDEVCHSFALNATLDEAEEYGPYTTYEGMVAYVEWYDMCMSF